MGAEENLWPGGARRSESSAAEALLAKIGEAEVELIYLQFTDVSGALKLVTIPASRLAACLESGVWFDGSAVEGIARVAESDLYLRPDPSTYALLPWEERPTARLICDLCLPDGSAFPADSRHALKSVLAEAEDLGFSYRVATELEFFVFDDQPADRRLRRPTEFGISAALVPIDGGGYFGVPDGRAARLCASITRALDQIGFSVETTHHEVAPGQQEIDLAEMDALAAADAIVTLKWAARAYARQAGLLVSFMPKPFEEQAGSGLHIQQVLAAHTTGADAFFDPAGQYQLSTVGGNFIAGQLAHARGMCAIVAPLVNSYKRLTGHYEAPARICWARTNRGALVRVPEVTPNFWTRVEFRAADPSCNPYLTLAVMLAAGLDGIRQTRPLPEPVEQPAHAGKAIDDQPDDKPRGGPDNADGADDLGDESLVSPLPEMLDEALEELDWDPIVRLALGQPIHERFLAAKEREWVAYRRHISQWELTNYLEGA